MLSPHVGRRRHAAHDDIVALDGVVPAEVVQYHSKDQNLSIEHDLLDLVG